MTRSAEWERWQNNYAGETYAFGKEPNAFLRSCRDLLPRHGRALAIADGEGRNGVWLATLGLDVVSVDFSPAGQAKAKALAAEHDVALIFVEADAHTWEYPPDAFDVVVDIFTQFSAPDERAQKWAGVRRTLKPRGLLILQGYTLKQLEYGTGGPKQADHLYTRDLLEVAFGDFTDVRIVEEERELSEGTRHVGRSALISLTGRKPATAR